MRLPQFDPLCRGLCAWLVMLGFVLTQGCYDHSFTQAIIERRRQAKAAEGAKIRASARPHAGAPGSASRLGRVRLYVSEEYRKQHGEWKKPWLEVIDAASAIVGPSFGVRLEVVATHAWEPKCDASRLAQCLNELAQLDPGEDGDWIVGVLGAVPRFTTSFDELGMAHVPGRHFVLRDISDLSEREAIDQAFASFTSARRDEIYKRRKAHKRLAVFLHEWGHTLGALHAASADSLLHPSYDDRMEAYDAGNQGLIAAALRDLFRYSGKHEELLAYLHGANDADWLGGERESLLDRLEGSSAQPTVAGATAGGEAPKESTPRHPFVVQGDDDVLLAALASQDRATYREAVRLTVAENSSEAWKTVAPLSERYPSSYAVQHLACGLAMHLGQHQGAQTACPRVSALASAGK